MKKKKYNGFWKWVFYVELIILAIIIYVIVEFMVLSPRSSIEHSLNSMKCASAICDCEEDVEFCECKYISNYYDDGEYDYETVTCHIEVEK